MDDEWLRVLRHKAFLYQVTHYSFTRQQTRESNASVTPSVLLLSGVSYSVSRAMFSLYNIYGFHHVIAVCAVQKFQASCACVQLFSASKEHDWVSNKSTSVSVFYRFLNISLKMLWQVESDFPWLSCILEVENQSWRLYWKEYHHYNCSSLLWFTNTAYQVS